MKPLPVAQLAGLLRYEPETGRLIWREWRHPRAPAGAEAGGTNTRGYRVVTIDGAKFYAHRIAWALHTGADMSAGFEVDHINGNKADNRIKNLRLATHQQNNCNRMSKGCAAGHRGVSRASKSKKWVARIKRHGRTKIIGHFDTPEEAHAAYSAAAADLHGEFARAT